MSTSNNESRTDFVFQLQCPGLVRDVRHPSHDHGTLHLPHEHRSLVPKTARSHHSSTGEKHQEKEKGNFFGSINIQSQIVLIFQTISLIFVR